MIDSSPGLTQPVVSPGRQKVFMDSGGAGAVQGPETVDLAAIQGLCRTGKSARYNAADRSPVRPSSLPARPRSRRVTAGVLDCPDAVDRHYCLSMRVDNDDT